jgi:hypothetical protein
MKEMQFNNETLQHTHYHGQDPNEYIEPQEHLFIADVNAKGMTTLEDRVLVFKITKYSYHTI